MDGDFTSQGLMRRGAAAGANSVIADSSANWNAAYAWGDHGTNGYATRSYVDNATGALHTTVSSEIDGDVTALSNALATVAFTGEADPVAATSVWGVAQYASALLLDGSRAMQGALDLGGYSLTNLATNSIVFEEGTAFGLAEVLKWNVAHGWGDHGSAGYIAGAAASNSFVNKGGDVMSGSLTVNSNVLVTGNLDLRGLLTNATYYGNGAGLTNIPSAAISLAGHNVTELDDVTSAGSGAIITTAERSKLGGIEAAADVTDAGNVSAAGAAMDGDFTSQGLMRRGAAAGAYSVIADSSANWDAAYAWGDHATNGYIVGSTVSNSFVKKSGDTMSGSLVLPAGGLTVGTTQLVVLANGNVGIGTANPTNALAVNGTIKAKETIITLDGWSDFVFEDDYELMPLADVAKFIERHGHLPGIPSAEDVARDGVRTGEMQAKLLEKVEELTLHMIELKKENARLASRIAELEAPRATDGRITSK